MNNLFFIIDFVYDLIFFSKYLPIIDIVFNYLLISFKLNIIINIGM